MLASSCLRYVENRRKVFRPKISIAASPIAQHDHLTEALAYLLRTLGFEGAPQVFSCGCLAMNHVFD